MYTGDASVGVSLLTPGTAERLGGTWYLSLDGDASEPIDAGAEAQEVLAAVQKLTAAGNVSVSDSEEGEGYSGERSWVVTFFDWNDPNLTVTVPSVVFIGGEDLVGTRAAAHLETSAGASITTDANGELEISQLCAKEVLSVTSLISSGEIDECALVATWLGGTAYAVPAFGVDANATSVEAAFADVDEVVLGEVWVTRQADPSASGGGVWDVTFVGNSEGRTPELQCALDADVSQVTSSTCAAIGGSFALAFEGNVTQDIAFDAPALEVRSLLWNSGHTQGLPSVSIGGESSVIVELVVSHAIRHHRLQRHEKVAPVIRFRERSSLIEPIPPIYLSRSKRPSKVFRA